MLRNLMLRAAASPRLMTVFASLGRRSGLSRRFIAGESLDEAIRVIRDLEGSGLRTTMDLLGENTTHEEESKQAAEAYCRLLHGIQNQAVGSTISIKLTQLGLDISSELCYRNLEKILLEAERLRNFVRIDMENSAHTEATIGLFRRGLDAFGPRRVGIVIQAYLYRSQKDIRDLSQLGCNIRLCKGAYMEDSDVAYPRKSDVDRNFCRLVDMLLDSPCFAAIATHDDHMIEHARSSVEQRNVPGDRFEFQMLFGVRREKQAALREQGYGMRVYVPFGTQWAPYFMRRLAERPANLLFLLRNFFRR
jgi:proline dehydrogenase